MPTVIHRQVEACRADAFPRRIVRMESGWVILGDPERHAGLMQTIRERLSRLG